MSRSLCFAVALLLAPPSFAVTLTQAPQALVGGQHVVIHWKTNVSSSTELGWGTSSSTTFAGYSNHAVVTGLLGTTHSRSLRRPVPGTYYYRVRSTDGSAPVESSEGTFVVTESERFPFGSASFTGGSSSVYAVAKGGSTWYVGGSFTNVSPLIGAGVLLDTSTGALVDDDFPEVNGIVHVVVPDGAGGFFIGGAFSMVAGQSRTGAAHLLPDRGLDPAWQPSLGTGSVFAIAVSGGTVYLGGDFSSSGPLPRRLVSVTSPSGTINGTWNPNPTGTVRAVAVSGGTVYFGGDFTAVNGSTGRNRVAAVDASTGVATAFNPNANDSVNAIAVSGTTVYLGGKFTQVNGVTTRNRAAAVDATTGVATTWNPNFNGLVQTLVLSAGDATVYFGGQFTTVNGSTTRRYAAAVAMSDGVATSFDPDPNGFVSGLDVGVSAVYLGGQFTTVGGFAHRSIAAVTPTSGAVSPWAPGFDRPVNAVAAAGTSLFVGGTFMGFATTETVRNRVAAIDATTGAVTAWNPNASGDVYSLLVQGTTVYLGGAFTSVNGATRNRLAAVSASSGTVTAWDPDVNNLVFAMTVDGSALYFGGDFTSVNGGTPRSRAAAVSLSNGVATSWDPNLSARVSALAVSGSTMYLGGSFTTANGSTPRSRAAAVDLATGVLTSWDPSPDNTVYAVAVSGSSVYLGGQFSIVSGGASRAGIAEVDGTTGTPTAFNPGAYLSTVVNSITRIGGVVYAAGAFTSIGSASRGSVAALDAATGAVQAWNPNFDAPAYVLAADATRLAVGGGFTRAWGQQRLSPAFAVVPIAPRATSQTLTTLEDTPLNLGLGAVTHSGNATFTIVAAPTHGTISGTSPNLVYTPAANFFGADTLTFKANDGVFDSPPATVDLTVTAVNDAPVAVSQSLSTFEDVAKAVTLSATDVEGSPTTLAVATQPSHGTLSGTIPSLVYTPAANYFGPDSFTFTANDGALDSLPGTISFSVTAVNDQPVATAQTLSTNEDTPLGIVLAGTDVETSALTYTIVAAPTHGSLSASLPNTTYTPTANYHGPDSFTFRVSDGALFSLTATVSLTVASVPDAPVATAQSVSLTEDVAKVITLSGTDGDGDVLTFTVTSPPGHGVLSGTPPTLTFTPTTNYAGSDAFSFKASDGTSDSAAATVTLDISPVNDAPTATAATLTTPEDTALVVTLAGSDAEGDTLNFTVVGPPAHGVLTGAPPNLTYTPATNYSGPDSFTFKVNDGLVDSALATITLTVTAVNDAPVAATQSLTTPEDVALGVVLSGSDAEGATLTFAIASPPSHGMLSGAPPNLTYTPTANYNGSDTFTFTASDGTVSSPAAAISLAVTAVNDAPVALDSSKSVAQATATVVSLVGSDVDGDTLTSVITAGPQHGSVTGTGQSLTYTPTATYTGPDSLSFKLNDGTADSNVATVTFSVVVDNAPVGRAQSVTTSEDTALPIVLEATDADGQALTYAVAQQPQHGSVTGAPPNVVYTPAADFNGTDAFAFTASDGLVDSNPATVSISVTAVNDAPVATSQSLTTPRDTPLALTLSGTDVDGDALSFSVTTPPTHGALTGTAPGLTYVPGAGFTGRDSVAFTVGDGQQTSAVALVTIDVVGGAPVDGGSDNDAGVADAGPTELDAGLSDAGVVAQVDGGGELPEEPAPKACGCDGAPLGLTGLVWVALARVWRRRARR